MDASDLRAAFEADADDFRRLAIQDGLDLDEVEDAIDALRQFKRPRRLHVGGVMLDELLAALGGASNGDAVQRLLATLQLHSRRETTTMEDSRVDFFADAGVALECDLEHLTSVTLYTSPTGDWAPYAGLLPYDAQPGWTAEVVQERLGPPLRHTQRRSSSLQYDLGSSWVWFVFGSDGVMRRVDIAWKAAVPHLAP